MAWLHNGEKNLVFTFIHLDTTHECDTQTPHDGIGRTYA